MWARLSLMYTFWSVALLGVWLAAGAPEAYRLVLASNTLLVACAVVVSHLAIPDVYTRLVAHQGIRWPAAVVTPLMAALDFATHFAPLLVVGLPSRRRWEVLVPPVALLAYSRAVDLPKVYLSTLTRRQCDVVIYTGVATYGVVAAALLA